MSRARLGALGLIAALSPALAFATGCDAVSDVKKSVDQASNKVEVCKASTALYNDTTTKVQAELAKASQAFPTDQAKAAAAASTVLKTELTALHAGLQEQVTKLKDNPEIKTVLTDLDTQIAALAAKPETVADPKSTAKLTAAVDALNKACDAKDPKK